MPAIFLSGITAAWSSLYGNSHTVSILVRYLHLVGLVLAGGTGLFADRKILRTVRAGPQERQAALEEMHGVHGHVVSFLFLVGFSGVLMTAADASTFLGSGLFWTKMALVVLLAANGVAMVVIERGARRDGIGAGWPKLVAVSGISAVLWLTLMLLGAMLTVAA